MIIRIDAFFAVVLISLLLVSGVFADGYDTSISWKGWKISSNEDIFLSKKHNSYPLTYLVDGNPANTWVFSGTGQHEMYDTRPKQPWIEIATSKIVDSIWIMNGYNRSRELFNRNNRIIQMQVVVNNRFVKTVELSDKMGWHKISIPRQRIHTLRLVAKKQIIGRDNDTCISELALYNSNKKIEMNLPKNVIYTTGAECGEDGEWAIMSIAGRKLANWFGDRLYYSNKTGNLTAGLDVVNIYTGATWIWVLDRITGDLIYHKPPKLRYKDDYTDDIEWIGNNRLKVFINHPKPTKDNPDNETYYVQVIEVE